MKLANPAETMMLALVGLSLVGAGHSMITITSSIAWTLFSLAALSLALAVEAACDTPNIDRIADRMWQRRHMRRLAQDAADKARMDAAFEAGLAKTRAYARNKAEAAVG